MSSPGILTSVIADSARDSARPSSVFLFTSCFDECLTDVLLPVRWGLARHRCVVTLTQNVLAQIEDLAWGKNWTKNWLLDSKGKEKDTEMDGGGGASCACACLSAHT